MDAGLCARGSRYNSLMNTQWNTFLTQRSAVFDHHRVSHFGNPAAELQATARGNIIADLSHLGLLQIEGDDAVTFLQGQVTNDVKQLNGNNSHYSGYCTPKGRMLALFLAFAHNGHLHLQLNGELTENVAKRLNMYVLRSKVSISNVSGSSIRIGIAGPQAATTLNALFGDAPQAPHQLIRLETLTLLRLPGTTPRFEIFTNPENAVDIWAQLQQTSTPVGASCWDWLDIQAGIPDVTPATVEAFVPQMLNLDLLEGISFKKGCYTGQEIVARTHYLGKVKRRTHLAHVDAPIAPQAGDPVYGQDSSEAIGMVVSAAPSPNGGFDVLAEIRLESVEAGDTSLSNEKVPTLTLRALPYQH